MIKETMASKQKPNCPMLRYELVLFDNSNFSLLLWLGCFFCFHF